MHAHPDVRHRLPEVIEDTPLDGERAGQCGINVVTDFAVREGQRRWSQPVGVVCWSNLPEVLAQMCSSHCRRVKDDDVRTCWNLAELVAPVGSRQGRTRLGNGRTARQPRILQEGIRYERYQRASQGLTALFVGHAAAD